ncbi:MAG: ABC transporter permease [Pirellulales bacterium]|nr:ABC transporter permease [Pirellulales bacterium]
MAQYFSNIWRLRFFWMALVRIDLKNRYRRSMIGVGWSLLHPILMTIVLCTFLGRLMQQDFRTYAPFLLSGLIFWNFITATLNQGCHCFFHGESYIRQYPAPLAIYPLRTALGAGVHFGIGLALVLVIVWIAKGFGNVPSLISLVPALLLIFILGWSAAVLMGVLNVLFQDCQHLIEVLIQVMFYVTPILYDPARLFPQSPNVVWCINHLNPLAIMLDLLRKPILEGAFPSATTFGLGVGVVALAAAAAAATLAKIENRMIFYL